MAFVADAGFGGAIRSGKVFYKRTERPSETNKYYIKNTHGGWSGCILGNSPWVPGAVLPNCVGYAIGRFNEIIANMGSNWVSIGGDAGQFMQSVKNSGKLAYGSKPQIGAIVVWRGGTNNWGHVAIVEAVRSETDVDISESSWATNGGSGPGIVFQYVEKVNPITRWNSSGYRLIGYIYNPTQFNGQVKIEPDYCTNDYLLNYTTRTSLGGSYTESQYNKYVAPKFKTQKITTTVTQTNINTVTDTNLTRTKSTTLLSYPSLVETPYITVKVGDVTFGLASKSGNLASNSSLNVTYPNYMQSLNVTKINGTVNQYTIKMVYQIETGQDPNLLDKIFSSVGYGTIHISYGDLSSPTFVYKEEEAIITKLSSNVDFSNSRITYTLQCTSNALSLLGSSYPFPARTSKPSAVIKDLLGRNFANIKEIFYGMKNDLAVSSAGLIPDDDISVSIPAKNTDILSYINFLVSCMICETNGNKNAIIKDSSYFLTICDDTFGENNLDGPYFKITKVSSGTGTIYSADTYEVDIGYPSDNLVTKFNLSDDNSWSLLYKYNDSLPQTRQFVYKINDEGIVETTSSSSLTTNNNYITTPNQMTWWTKMTQFPVSATLELKGLVRPAMLMTYLRVNALFYGQRHVSSGLYIITKQEDVIDINGYRTVLSLTRVAGDQDYLTTVSKQVTTEVITYTGNATSNTTGKTSSGLTTTHTSSSGTTHGGGGSHKF